MLNRFRILAALRPLPHFAAVRPERLEHLARGCRIRSFDEGQVIFREGERCTGFFVVATGAVRLFRTTEGGREQTVHRRGPGETFAEAAALCFGKYPVSATASERGTELIVVDGPDLCRLLREDDQLARSMIGSLCLRLASLVDRVETLSLVSTSARFAHWLLQAPTRGGADSYVELPMSKRALAAHLAMAPETLSRLLRRWKEQGWIETEGRGVRVLDGAALVELADGPRTRTGADVGVVRH